MLIAAVAMKPCRSSQRRPSQRRRPGGDRRVPLRRASPSDPVDVRDRPRRDDLRHARRALPGAGCQPIRPARRWSDCLSRRPLRARLAQVLFSGSVTRIRHQGEAVIWAVAGWGRRSPPSASSGRTAARLALPRDRGRRRRGQRDLPVDDPAGHGPGPVARAIVGHLLMVVTGGPKLGDVEAGLVATWFTPTISA